MIAEIYCYIFINLLNHYQHLCASINHLHQLLEHKIANIVANKESFNSYFQNLNTTYTFFDGLKFITKNTVILGPNGSGKTTITQKLREIIPNYSGVVISAQKILALSELGSISRTGMIEGQLKAVQITDKRISGYKKHITIKENYILYL